VVELPIPHICCFVARQEKGLHEEAMFSARLLDGGNEHGDLVHRREGFVCVHSAASIEKLKKQWPRSLIRRQHTTQIEVVKD